jgi:hypothetical protein
MTIDTTHQPRLLEGARIKVEGAVRAGRDAIRQGLVDPAVEAAVVDGDQLAFEMKGIAKALPHIRPADRDVMIMLGEPLPPMGIPADRLRDILRRADEIVSIIEGGLPEAGLKDVSVGKVMGRRLFPTVPLLDIRECANRFNKHQLIQLALQHNLPADGNKIELCARLVAAKAVPG